MIPTPVLFTPRLVLRLPEPQDFDAYAAFAADPVAMAHLGGTMHRGVAWRDFTLRAGGWMTRGFSMFSVIERASGCWIGRIGPWQPDGWPGTEVGGAVGSAHVGKGYAFEAATAAIDYAVDLLGWRDVIHTIAPDNLRSARLAARLGSTNRGPTRLPPPLDGYAADVWGQRADAWRARRAA